nr:DUF2163 domain-containing protein [uncultured Roseateles sp.]
MRSTLWETSAGALVALLNSGAPLNKADLYTLTLASGAVLRWSGSDVPLAGNGHLWTLGPGINRGRIKWVVGAEVDTMDLTLLTDEARPCTIAGVPLLAYIRAGGLSGARLQLDRAFWGAGDTAPRGALLWFAGKFADIKQLDRRQAQITIVSAIEALTNMVPGPLYQAGCLSTVFDARCGLSRAAFTSTGHATTGTDATRSVFSTDLAQAGGYFGLGTLTFTSGANDGLQRSVKLHVHTGGVITLMSPLPAPVVAGDSFSIVPGCDGLQNTCEAKFSNVIRFRGKPYIPQPETIT